VVDLIMSLVSTDRLTKDFTTGFWRPRPHRGLDALTLQIPAGGVFGLLGPNGAGKSTTLKLLLDLLRPTSGRAEVLGRPAGDAGARQRLGFLPENPTFYDHLTAEELLSYFAGLFGFHGEDRRQRASRALDRVGLGADRRRPIRQYSKGMVQRVGLAQALVNEPELVILDEPMSGLDPIGRRDVRELILELRDEGRTVLFSSHILSDAELLCSAVGILDRGRLMVSGRLDDLTAGAATGWEIVMASLDAPAVDRLGDRVRSRKIAEGRYSLTLPADGRPEPIVAELASAGAALVSVSPLRTTLEDVFLRALDPAAPGAAPGTSAPGTSAPGTRHLAPQHPGQEVRS
jgi:ABC-2 type transport system ATP-binding protein